MKFPSFALKPNLLTIIINFSLIIEIIDAASCVNDQGVEVDFFIALKLPNSFEYYIISSPEPFSLEKSTNMLNESGMNSAIEMTLAPIYAELPNDYGYAMYNDETKNTSTSYYAHAKGTIYFEQSQGFWLIHSMPKYPSTRWEGYTGFYDKTYGQSFICVTLETSNFELVAQQLEIARPMIFDKKITPDLSNKLPTFTDWISGGHSSTTDNTISLQTINGYSFTHIAKSKEWADDLYENLVAPTLDCNLRTETWQHGTKTNNMPSFCSPNFSYNIENIQNLQLPEDSWKNTQDHSKWAVSSESDKPFVCIGDINRQYSQEKRGGGTLCYNDATINSIFLSIISQYDSCDSTTFQ